MPTSQTEGGGVKAQDAPEAAQPEGAQAPLCCHTHHPALPSDSHASNSESDSGEQKVVNCFIPNL